MIHVKEQVKLILGIHFFKLEYEKYYFNIWSIQKIINEIFYMFSKSKISSIIYSYSIQ